MTASVTFAPTPAHLSERLRSESNVWLCSLRPDGSPHVTPVWFVHLRQRWWVCASPMAVKARNVAADPRVTLALENGDAPVVAEGRATVHAQHRPEGVVDTFRERYDWDIRTPLPGTGQSRALIEIGTTRWLMSGVAQ